METTLPLLLAASVGFSHAFEADHLVAIGNIVVKRDKLLHAIKDGIFWGLGHTSTIFVIGLIMLAGKLAIEEQWFGYFEAFVGLTLVILGTSRLLQFWSGRSAQKEKGTNGHHPHLAYSVGLVHGLAGSGAVVLLAMTEIRETTFSLLYLLIFGLGSIAGMLLAAGIFSLPFSQRFTSHKTLQGILTVLSSMLCIGYGLYILFEHLSVQ